MAKLINTFVKGLMNKDLDVSLLPQDIHTHAENLIFSTSNGKDRTGTNVKGNEVIGDATGGNSDFKCIGAYFSKDNDCIYYFLASSTGAESKVVEFNTVTKVTTVVLDDDRGLLNFNKQDFITGVSEIDGLLLFAEWGNNPRRVNIERAKGYGLNNFDETDISLAVIPPTQKIKTTLQDTSTTIEKENNIEEKMLYFSYRYRMIDGEYTALAPFTTAAFEPKTFNYDFSTQENKSMVNKFNQVLLEFNTGSELVKEIQLVFKESDTSNAFIIDDFIKDNLGWGNNETRSFTFDNLKSIRSLPQQVLRDSSSRVPKTAKGLMIIDGRVMLANYLEDYDLVDDQDNEIELDYTLEVVSEDLAQELVPERTVKTLRDYEVVFAYYDEFFRGTTALSSKTNTVFVKQELSVKANSIDVLIKHKAPKFAKYFQFFIRQNGKDYDQILPVTFYEDGSFRWVKLENSEIDKIKEGDTLYVKADSRGILTETVKVKVLEIKVQERNFLETDNPDTVEQFAGTYFKIKPDGFNMQIQDLILHNYEGYFDNSGFNDVIRNNTNYIQPAIYYGSTGTNDLTSSGTYTANIDQRYLIEIDSLGDFATATITLTGGTTGDEFEEIKVNGVIDLIDDVVPFNTDLPTTAIDIANAINAFSSGYTASPSGNDIIIANPTPGDGANGDTLAITGGVTGTTTNFSGGTNNSFRWSLDDGANYEQSNVAITPNVAQALSDGVEITFLSDTGHLIDDSWVVPAKSSSDDALGNDEDSYAFAIFQGPQPDKIRAGATITITYDEYGDEKQFVQNTFISSTNYANLEEWYYGENIDNFFATNGIDSDRIWWRRGIVDKTSNGFTTIDSINITSDGTGSMNLIIRSKGVENSNLDDTAKVKTTIDISQSDVNIVFETEPKESLPEIFYETGKVYNVTNGFHIADTANVPTDVNQTASVDGRIKIDWFNAWAFGNSVESYKVLDGFNKKGLDEGVRAISRTLEKYKESHRDVDITWSDVYNDDNNFNGLSSFNASLLNWIRLERENGTIQRLHNANGSVMVLQEDSVGLLPYNKNIIYDTQGGSTIGVSTNILNKSSYNPYDQGGVGISKDPASFISLGSRNYFTHKQKGNIIRIANDGAFEINSYGFEYESSNLMIRNQENKIISGYDPKTKRILFYFPSENGCLNYVDNTGAKGFPCYMTFEPDFMLGANNEFYTWKNGVMYLHNSETEDRNNFYGVQYESKIKFIVNHQFREDKIFNNLGIHSTHPWLANLKTRFMERQIPKECFDKQNQYWYSEIMGNTKEDVYNNNIFGIGTLEIVNGVITTAVMPDGISVGDTIISDNNSFTEIDIIDISENTITISAAVNLPTSLLMFKKNQNIDGSNIKGNYMEVELINDDTEEVQIKAVKTEAVKNIMT